MNINSAKDHDEKEIDFSLTPASPLNSDAICNDSIVGNAELNSISDITPVSFSSPKALSDVANDCAESSFQVPSEATLNKQQMSWDLIKDKPGKVKLYTGCHKPEIFLFLVNHVRPKHVKLQYYKGRKSFSPEPKQYQISPVKPYCQNKPGPSRKLSLEDEILMTLMKIRLNLPIEDLGFRFNIHTSHASNIITTFICFLGLELKPFIYWPTPAETLSFKHPHFAGTLNSCEGIGDCVEQEIEHSKNTDAQYKTYSTYKSRNTLKRLIFCTKSGSVSYISEAYGGACSDRFITESSGVVNKFTPNFSVLFDKGFNVQDLFLSRQVKCCLPPFVRQKRQFTRSEVYHGKRIARARIHIERVMGRLKEFKMLEHKLPINMIEMSDHVWTIAGAILNMQPPLVKVK